MTVVEVGSSITVAATPAAGRLRCHTFDGPRVSERALLQLDPTSDQFVLEGQQSDLWFGLGSAWELRASGPDRLSDLVTQADALFERVEVQGDGDLTPRVFGGIAFAPEVSDPIWTAFSAASFVLPRVLVHLQGDRSRWLLVDDQNDGAEDGDGANRAARTIERLWARLDASATEHAVGPTAPQRIDPASLADEPPAEWVRQVRGAVEEIRSDRLSKVVCARRERVRRADRRDVDLFLALAEESSPTRRFFFRREGQTFLGKTPERLIRKVGLEVDTVALAGSLQRQPHAPVAELGERLLESEKDRHEHQLVVDCLREQLEPLCSELTIGQGAGAARPSIRVLEYLIHLETAVHGRLMTPMHVLDLVQALHPTPAVGGMPRGRALEWILRHETFDRGWYAGPVGWFDGSGDGDFHVALRSFLIDHDQVHLFAGAGIVEGSDPFREFDETEDKLAASRAALTAPATAGTGLR